MIESKEESYLSAYRNFINEVDDYFEYRNESLKDRKKVHELLDKLSEELFNISKGKL